MQDRQRTQWETLGATDPYWAVLSFPSKRGGKWEAAEFFETGRREIAEVLTRLEELGAQPKRGTALDFGCGVGRLSRAMSGHFGRVIGIDISESMLKEARSANSAFANIEFVHNEVENLDQIPSRSVDFVYSNIVLQHMPAARQRVFVKEFCRVLSPGGALVFQTPSRPNPMHITGWAHLVAGNRVLNVVRGMLYGRDRVMELHALPKHSVVEMLDAQGMTLLEAEPNDFTGKSFISYRYYATKK